MNFLKKTLIAAVIIIAVPLIAAIFIKKSYSVERDTVINKPVDEVFRYVKLLKNQDNYSKWAAMDPGMKKEYRGTDGKVGFVSAWQSADKNVGKGEQEITNIIEGERIDYELRFMEPWESITPAYMITERISDRQTKVRWGINGRFNYPMNLMTLFMDMDKMMGPDFETGLTNLKTILEKQ